MFKKLFAILTGRVRREAEQRKLAEKQQKLIEEWDAFEKEAAEAAEWAEKEAELEKADRLAEAEEEADRLAEAEAEFDRWDADHLLITPPLKAIAHLIAKDHRSHSHAED